MICHTWSKNCSFSALKRHHWHRVNNTNKLCYYTSCMIDIWMSGDALTFERTCNFFVRYKLRMPCDIVCFFFLLFSGIISKIEFFVCGTHRTNQHAVAMDWKLHIFFNTPFLPEKSRKNEKNMFIKRLCDMLPIFIMPNEFPCLSFSFFSLSLCLCDKNQFIFVTAGVFHAS